MERINWWNLSNLWFWKTWSNQLIEYAGGWILAGKDELKLYANNNIIVNTCELHVKQKINRSTTDKDLRNKLYKIIYEDEDKTLFKTTMQEIIDSKVSNQGKIKFSMESHILHCIASKFSSRPKAILNIIFKLI